MTDIVYLVIGHDHGYRNIGDYVSLYGIYIDKYEAKERMVELIKEPTDIIETFEVVGVEFNQNIDIGLGVKEIRPDYYKSGEMEAFDVIDAFNLNFNLGNAFKYIARAGKKGDKVRDLRKAVTYLNREIEKEDKKRDEAKRKVLDGRLVMGEPVKDWQRESDYETWKLENI